MTAEPGLPATLPTTLPCVRVWALRIAAGIGTPATPCWVAQGVSAEERRRAATLRHPADRNAYLGAHGLLRTLLANVLSLPSSALAFGRRPCPQCGGPGGRPYLLGGHRVEFSLSHVRGMALVALSERAVGVDVIRLADQVTVTAEERARTNGPDPRPGLTRALHPSERAEVSRLASWQKERALLRCWARKEAVLKAAGTGIAHGVAWPPVGTGRIPLRTDSALVEDLNPGSGFLAAVAVDTSPQSPGNP